MSQHDQRSVQNDRMKEGSTNNDQLGSYSIKQHVTAYAVSATSPCPLQLRSWISAQRRPSSPSYVPVGIFINLDVCMSCTLANFRMCERTEK